LSSDYERSGRTRLMMRALPETGARVSARVKVRDEDISPSGIERFAFAKQKATSHGPSDSLVAGECASPPQSGRGLKE